MSTLNLYYYYIIASLSVWLLIIFVTCGTKEFIMKEGENMMTDKNRLFLKMKKAVVIKIKLVELTLDLHATCKPLVLTQQSRGGTVQL